METRLETQRLQLRPIATEDAPSVAQLAGRREIADTTISVPHPYSVEEARVWIATRSVKENPPTQAVFAVTLKPEGQLIGTVGLREIDREHGKAELGIWIGVDWWGRGFATEAIPAVLKYGFTELNLNRIQAHHMVRNPASGRVLEKIGMRREGLLRQFVCKWGVFEDVVVLAILREDWQKSREVA